MNNSYILVSSPNIIGDPHFHRTVVLVVENSKESLMGFTINKKLDYSLNEVSSGIEKKIPLYFGGPVDTDSLFYIYKSKIKVSGSKSISKNLNWGGNFDEIKSLINQDKISKKDIKFFLGYSGWDTNQLNDEIQNKNWEIINSMDDEMILKNQTENIWKNFLNSLGGEYLIWSNSPENPNHN